MLHRFTTRAILFALCLILCAACAPALALATDSNPCKDLFDSSAFDEAIAACTELQQRQGASVSDQLAALGIRGRSKIAKRDFNAAIGDFDEALALDPAAAEILNWRGVAFRRLGNYDMAIRDHTKAISLKKDFAEAYNYRGLAYKMSGQKDKALEDFDQAIRIIPGYVSAINNRAESTPVSGGMEAHTRQRTERWKPFKNSSMEFGYENPGAQWEKTFRPQRR